MPNKKKIVINIFISGIVFMFLFLPLVSRADPQPLNSLVPCDNSAGNPCGFKELLGMINKIITFVLYKMVLPISAIMFAYAGISMVTAGGESAEAMSKAKGVFTNTFLGLVIAMSAWLVIKLILSILGYDGAWIGFK